MKKLIIIAMAIALLLPVNSFAATANNATAGSSLELVGLLVGMSPGVFSYYADDGTADPQWYTIGTMHAGGSKIYGTAQNSTSVFSQPAESPNVLADLTGAGFPTALTDTESEEWWSTSGWTR